MSTRYLLRLYPMESFSIYSSPPFLDSPTINSRLLVFIMLSYTAKNIPSSSSFLIFLTRNSLCFFISFNTFSGKSNNLFFFKISLKCVVWCSYFLSVHSLIWFLSTTLKCVFQKWWCPQKKIVCCLILITSLFFHQW